MTTEQIQSIIDYFELGPQFFVYQGQHCSEAMDEDDRLTAFYEYEVEHSPEIEHEIIALMQHTDETYEDCYDYIYESYDYKVLTDDEAEKELEEYYGNYVEDVVLPEIPECYQYYFDEERFIDDIKSDSNRGNALSSYDGTEHEEVVDGTTYYIYRQ